MHSTKPSLVQSKKQMAPKKTLMMAIENMSSPRISHNGSKEGSVELNLDQIKTKNRHMIENSINYQEH